eukprot:TRINITY_DN31246_c0_g1_i2.p1 TRINITY_DN31246_c0_g1~~TRINITY_DN31246_c0_g1_i2.p1  ORF type:complete len:237 (-),score=-11.66 TRINITY_DN31246_c0_g1_i2:84-794(-)
MSYISQMCSPSSCARSNLCVKIRIKFWQNNLFPWFLFQQQMNSVQLGFYSTFQVIYMIRKSKQLNGLVAVILKLLLSYCYQNYVFNYFCCLQRLVQESKEQLIYQFLLCICVNLFSFDFMKLQCFPFQWYIILYYQLLIFFYGLHIVVLQLDYEILRNFIRILSQLLFYCVVMIFQYISFINKSLGFQLFDWVLCKKLCILQIRMPIVKWINCFEFGGYKYVSGGFAQFFLGIFIG